MSTKSEFRDVLDQACAEVMDDVDPIGMDLGGNLIYRNASLGEAVLATPEMQAIRRALRSVGEYDLRFTFHVQESVIDWVLAEDGGR